MTVERTTAEPLADLTSRVNPNMGDGSIGRFNVIAGELLCRDTPSVSGCRSSLKKRNTS